MAQAASSATIPPVDPRSELLNALARRFMAVAAGKEVKPVEAAIVSRAALDLQSISGTGVGLNSFAMEDVEQFLAMALFEAALGRRPTVKPIAAKFLLANLFPERWSMLPQSRPSVAVSSRATIIDEEAIVGAPPFRIRIARTG